MSDYVGYDRLPWRDQDNGNDDKTWVQEELGALRERQAAASASKLTVEMIREYRVLADSQVQHWLSRPHTKANMGERVELAVRLFEGELRAAIARVTKP